MSITTKRGDSGQTDLLGGVRIAKDAVRMHAIGSVDELNAALGIVLADATLMEPLRSELLTIQRLLFKVGADLALDARHTERSRSAMCSHLTSEHLATLESWITRLEYDLPSLTHFILPGGTSLAAHLHLARAICRRSERWIVTTSRSSGPDLSSEALVKEEILGPLILPFINRLSDYLFLAARTCQRSANDEEEFV